jgi:hypothetical protein
VLPKTPRVRRPRWTCSIFGWQYELIWYPINGGIHLESIGGDGIVGVTGFLRAGEQPRWSVFVRCGPRLWAHQTRSSMTQAAAAVAAEIDDIERGFVLAGRKKRRNHGINTKRRRTSHE